MTKGNLEMIVLLGVVMTMSSGCPDSEAVVTTTAAGTAESSASGTSAGSTGGTQPMGTGTGETSGGSTASTGDPSTSEPATSNPDPSATTTDDTSDSQASDPSDGTTGNTDDMGGVEDQGSNCVPVRGTDGVGFSILPFSVPCNTQLYDFPVNQMVSLPCTDSYIGIPSVSWYGPGRMNKLEDFEGPGSIDHVYRITWVPEAEHMVVQCASNDIGGDKIEGYLTLIGLPPGSQTAHQAIEFTISETCGAGPGSHKDKPVELLAGADARAVAITEVSIPSHIHTSNHNRDTTFLAHFLDGEPMVRGRMGGAEGAEHFVGEAIQIDLPDDGGVSVETFPFSYVTTGEQAFWDMTLSGLDGKWVVPVVLVEKFVSENFNLPTDYCAGDTDDELRYRFTFDPDLSEYTQGPMDTDKLTITFEVKTNDKQGSRIEGQVLLFTLG